MLLRDAHVRLAEDRPGDFRRGPQREEHRRKTSPKGMPSVPSVADRGPDHATAQVIEVQRASHLFARKDPLAVSRHPPMGVENFTERFDHRNRILAFQGFRIPDMVRQTARRMWSKSPS